MGQVDTRTTTTRRITAPPARLASARAGTAPLVLALTLGTLASGLPAAGAAAAPPDGDSSAADAARPAHPFLEALAGCDPLDGDRCMEGEAVLERDQELARDLGQQVPNPEPGWIDDWPGLASELVCSSRSLPCGRIGHVVWAIMKARANRLFTERVRTIFEREIGAIEGRDAEFKAELDRTLALQDADERLDSLLMLRASPLLRDARLPWAPGPRVEALERAIASELERNGLGVLVTSLVRGVAILPMPDKIWASGDVHVGDRPSKADALALLECRAGAGELPELPSFKYGDTRQPGVGFRWYALQSEPGDGELRFVKPLWSSGEACGAPAQRLADTKKRALDGLVAATWDALLTDDIGHPYTPTPGAITYFEEDFRISAVKTEPSGPVTVTLAKKVETTFDYGCVKTRRVRQVNPDGTVYYEEKCKEGKDVIDAEVVVTFARLPRNLSIKIGDWMLFVGKFVSTNSRTTTNRPAFKRHTERAVYEGLFIRRTSGWSGDSVVYPGGRYTGR